MSRLPTYEVGPLGEGLLLCMQLLGPLIPNNQKLLSDPVHKGSGLARQLLHRL